MTTATNARDLQDQRHDRVWTPTAIRDLGASTDIETAAAIIGFGRTKAYAMARIGEFPVRTVRIGRRYVVPIAGILELLGCGHAQTGTPETVR